MAATPDWLHNRRCLVAGLGPVGLLATLALRLRGAEVYGLDIVEADSARPQWLAHIGGQYVDGRQVPAENVGVEVGDADNSSVRRRRSLASLADGELPVAASTADDPHTDLFVGADVLLLDD